MANKIRSEAERPYDASLEGHNMSMYDKLPYKRNEELCNAQTLGLNSGNLLKFYRCNQAVETREITNQDENFSHIVSDHIKKDEKEYIARHKNYPLLFGPLGGQEEDEDEEDSSDDEEYDSDDDE